MSIALTASDGTVLAAHRFGAGPCRVVVAGATGVPQRFYARFAAYLAECGLSTLTFDYRGIGASKDSPRHHFGMRTWAEQDLASAIEYAASGGPVAVIGHSFGGQALGLCGNNHHVKALLGISAQSGHWRLWDWPYKPWMWSMMHVVLPAILAVRRDIPGGLLGPDSLPGGVVREWARWCRGPHYIADTQGNPLRAGFTQWTGTARFYLIEDDQQYAPPRAVHEPASFYAQAQCEVIERAPSDWGIDALGHFDFFRPSAVAGWAEVAKWLTATLDGPETRPAKDPIE